MKAVENLKIIVSISMTAHLVRGMTPALPRHSRRSAARSHILLAWSLLLNRHIKMRLPPPSSWTGDGFLRSTSPPIK